jgi:oxalate decarboxylase/phosphoglucose isomerase-like protein (cupin superfamily)
VIQRNYRISEFDNDTNPSRHYYPTPALECVQEPGDLLYLPSQWYHSVRNIGDTVAVSALRRVNGRTDYSLTAKAPAGPESEEDEDDEDDKDDQDGQDGPNTYRGVGDAPPAP